MGCGSSAHSARGFYLKGQHMLRADPFGLGNAELQQHGERREEESRGNAEELSNLLAIQALLLNTQSHKKKILLNQASRNLKRKSEIPYPHIFSSWDFFGPQYRVDIPRLLFRVEFRGTHARCHLMPNAKGSSSLQKCLAFTSDREAALHSVFLPWKRTF